MVGDARIYYVGRSCDYWVTFSRSPLAEAVEAAEGRADRVIDWLRRQGYTHVYVDFGGDPAAQPDLRVRSGD